MINIYEMLTILLRMDHQEGHDQDRLEEQHLNKIQNSLKRNLMFTCLIGNGHLRLHHLATDQDLVTTMTILNVEEGETVMEMEDFHVVPDHEMRTRMMMRMCRRQDQLVRDPDLEMMTNNVKDRDLETILGDKTDPDQETMIMIIWTDAQYILMDYDPSTHLAIKGQHTRRRVRHQN